MSKHLPLILFIALAISCASRSEKGAVDTAKPYIKIDLTFNPDTYPWLMGKKYPTFAVWIEEKKSGYVHTIFVTGKAGKNKWMMADERPSSAPVWMGIRKKAASTMEIDSVTGATPGGDGFTIYWQVPENLANRSVDIFLEGNVSFDYNAHYRKDAGKSDTGYSDVNGQPSLVWKGTINTGGGNSETVPVIIGHGSVLGTDSVIDSDLSRITSAKNIFSYIKYSYFTGTGGNR